MLKVTYSGRLYKTLIFTLTIFLFLTSTLNNCGKQGLTNNVLTFLAKVDVGVEL